MASARACHHLFFFFIDLCSAGKAFLTSPQVKKKKQSVPSDNVLFFLEIMVIKIISEFQGWMTVSKYDGKDERSITNLSLP